jgi:signal transduction histidine kinase/ActR/RegA family two-component response regulator
MNDNRKSKTQLIKELQEARARLADLSDLDTQQHDQLMAMFDGMQEVAYLADPDTYELLFLNRVSKEAWGDRVGEKCYKVFQNRDDPCPFCTNDKIFGENIGKTHIWEFQNEVNKRWYRCIDRAIRLPNGKFARFELALDLSDQKQAEEDKEKLEEQLRHAQKMEAVGRLAGGMAHDFNNVLCAIIGNTSLVLNNLPSGHPLSERILEIESAANRAADLIKQLLAFSRKQIAIPEIVDVSKLIGNMHSMLTRLIGEDIILETEVNKEPGRVRIDPSQIEQIMFNLVINARDAMPDGGELRIETRNMQLDDHYCRRHARATPGNYVVLAISDTGQGMSAETRERIFEPFFTTKRLGQGTGLGLSTVFGIVEQNDGWIEVYSEPGTGSTFRVYLPTVTTDQEDDGLHISSEAPRAPGGNETILLVEDEKIVRDIAESILKVLGYKVLTSGSGVDAINQVKKYNDPIDLLLTDVVMPQMNGRELADKISGIKSGLKVLYSSGYTQDIIARHGILDADIDFISKPYTLPILAKRIREVLDKGKVESRVQFQ